MIKEKWRRIGPKKMMITFLITHSSRCVILEFTHTGPDSLVLRTPSLACTYIALNSSIHFVGIFVTWDS